MRTSRLIASGSCIAMLALFAGPAFADGYGGGGGCSSLPGWSVLKQALIVAVNTPGNGGLNNNMWGTIVANDGTVCAVAFTGSSYTDQWLGSRVIAAQKANTATDFNLGKNSTAHNSAGLALSTANLFSAVQPGGSLYGLQHSNPVDTDVAYGEGPGHSPPANAGTFGTASDPMVGQRVGGVNVFGGGLGLYAAGEIKVGGVGVSGDQSCTDHMIAWRVRNILGLDHLATIPGPASLFAGDATHPDNIIFDIQPNPDETGSAGPFPYTSGEVGHSASGFGHPQCYNNPNQLSLPPVRQ
jgi:Haem-degrading